MPDTGQAPPTPQEWRRCVRFMLGAFVIRWLALALVVLAPLLLWPPPA
jgi:hypothetical protein